MLQLPVATLALQLWVPSLTVTLPVGVPPPGAFGTTVNVKLTAWPTAEGSGVCPVIVVVVPAAFTVWGRPLETLDRKSTRLNSSHGYISYAVFCLKKKKKI